MGNKIDKNFKKSRTLVDLQKRGWCLCLSVGLALGGQDHKFGKCCHSSTGA